MKKALVFIGIALTTSLFVSCTGKSEKDIEALVAAKYQHAIDSMKLAEAEAKLAQKSDESSSKSSHRSSESSHSSSHSSYNDAPVRSSSSYNTEFDWLSERYCTYDDIAGLSQWDLCVLRNSIYARHGRKFKRADLRAYFGQFGWYHPRYTEVQLSSIESRNVSFIKQFE